MKTLVKSLAIHEYQYNINFKKDLLLFDNILFDIDSYSAAVSTLNKNNLPDDMLFITDRNFKEIEFLDKNGLIIQSSSNTLVSKLYDLAENSNYLPNELINECNNILRYIDYINIINTEELNTDERIFEKMLSLEIRQNLVSRIMAITQGILDKKEYYSSISNASSITNSPLNRKHSVLAMLLNKIPMLNDDTSWEAILEFKSDEDIKRKFYALINWVNDVAAGNLSQNEIEDKYNFLYNEYVNQLKLHKQKTQETKFEVLVNAPLSTIENIAKINFSKLLEPFFKIRRAELDLLEAETKITGRELAYIYDVNKKFK